YFYFLLFFSFSCSVYQSIYPLPLCYSSSLFFIFYFLYFFLPVYLCFGNQALAVPAELMILVPTEVVAVSSSFVAFPTFRITFLLFLIFAQTPHTWLFYSFFDFSFS